jgi:dTDP-4-dehydrorhamnose 3,5-epimerase
MPDRFHIEKTPLPGLLVMRREPLRDDRGLFERMLCVQELAPWLAGRTIVQINRSSTAPPGTVRGMHSQRPPHAEMKIVTCLRGEVFDVAVDIRRNSPTFLRWHGEILREGDHRSMLIPEGFAHGFQTLAPACDMLYLHTAAYQPQSEVRLNAEDPALAIAWPRPITGLSNRDRLNPMLTPDFSGVDP